MKNSFTLLLLALSVLISCKESENSHQTRVLNNLIAELTDNNLESLDKTYYLLIPLEGCSSCIKYAVDFAKRNASNKDFIFIVSHYDSKVIKRSFKSQQENVLVDSKSEALGSGLVVASPTLIKVIDKKIVSTTFLETRNIHDVLSGLEYVK